MASSLVRITEMWRLPDADGTGAEYHVVVHGTAEEDVTPCRIAGHFPWLPPTPAPTGAPVPSRDGEDRPPSLPRTVREVAITPRRIRKLPPMRKVLEAHKSGHWLTEQGAKVSWLCHLECGHPVVKLLRLERTTCPRCPLEFR